MENLRRVEDPRRPAGSRVQVASLVDLAGMKLRVIQMRGNWKDYVDIHALVSHGIEFRPRWLRRGRSMPSFSRKSACVLCSFMAMARWRGSRLGCSKT